MLNNVTPINNCIVITFVVLATLLGALGHIAPSLTIFGYRVGDPGMVGVGLVVGVLWSMAVVCTADSSTKCENDEITEEELPFWISVWKYKSDKVAEVLPFWISAGIIIFTLA